jgi:hypothetical protein
MVGPPAGNDDEGNALIGFIEDVIGDQTDTRLIWSLPERMFGRVDLGYELMTLRQSIAKLPRYEKVLDRGGAMTLIKELEDVRGRLDRLREGLARLLDASRP